MHEKTNDFCRGIDNDVEQFLAALKIHTFVKVSIHRDVRKWVFKF